MEVQTQLNQCLLQIAFCGTLTGSTKARSSVKPIFSGSAQRIAAVTEHARNRDFVNGAERYGDHVYWLAVNNYEMKK